MVAGEVYDSWAKGASERPLYLNLLPDSCGGSENVEDVQHSSMQTPTCASGARQSNIPSTIKARMGATHFPMKRLPNVAAEMALHLLTYNLTRMLRSNLDCINEVAAFAIAWSIQSRPVCCHPRR